MITGAVNIITTLIAIAFVDKFGRKPLLVLGSIGMIVTLGTMASLFGTARTYVLVSGCKWRDLPGDFPAWQTVYTYFRNWRIDGTTQGTFEWRDA